MSIHRHGEEYRRKLERRRRESRKILKNFMRVAEAVSSKGGRIAYEWPRHATGWKLPELLKFIGDFGLYTVDCDGCAFGMQSDSGEPLLKQWRIVTNCGRLAKALAVKRCQHPSEFRHGEISGSVSPKTASYPMAMCETIASAWYPKAVSGHVPAMGCTRACGPHVHREKVYESVDFADMPHFSPAELIVALTATAMPAAVAEVTAVGEEAVGDLPAEMRLSAKSGDGKVRVVFAETHEEISPTGESQLTPVRARTAEGPVESTDEAGSLRAPVGPELVESVAPSNIDPQITSIKEKKAIEARTLRHLVLHETKNPECTACGRGKIRKASGAVSKGRQADAAMEAQAQRPTEYRQLVQADNVIASPAPFVAPLLPPFRPFCTPLSLLRSLRALSGMT
jgi:hypothetical protein